jgi:WD40 repeat protein
MTRRLFVLIAIVAALALAPLVRVQAQDRPVRLVWFPRFSPDGKWLITAHGGWEATEGGEARVWDAETGKEKFVVRSERGVRTVGWLEKGKLFVAGNYGGLVRFYNFATGNPTDEIRFPASAEVLQVSPDDKRLITAHGDGTVRVTEIISKKNLHAWDRVHKGGIWGMRLSGNGKVLASAGKDGFVRVYDMQSFKVLHELKHPGETNGLAFTKDGKFLFTGCTDSTIRVFDVEAGKELRQLQEHTGGSITDIDVAPDGKLLASAGIDQTVRLWDLADFEKPSLTATLDGHTSFVFGVAISPKGKHLASVGWDEKIQVFELATQKELWSWQR